MKTQKRILGISLIIIALFFTAPLEAQRKDYNRKRDMQTARSHSKTKRVKSNHYRHDRYRTQPIRRKPHYRYPRHRRVVRALHRNHVRFVFRGLTYFYYAGVYYTSYGNEYIVVVPPVGYRIGVLPVGYVRVVFGPSVYYYHSGIYYVKSKSESIEEKYEITNPAVGTVVTDISKDSKEVVVDGKSLIEYNDVLYKKIKTSEGKTGYEVVHVKEN